MPIYIGGILPIRYMGNIVISADIQYIGVPIHPVAHLAWKEEVCCGRAAFDITFQHNYIFSYDYKPTDDFCDVAKVSHQRNSADIQYIGNICS